MKKIILSTDIGSDIDDALALLAMLNCPDIDLRLISTVNGDVVSRSYIAKRMVDLSEKKIAVACGKEKPLGAAVAPYRFFECDLVDDMFIDEKRMEEIGVYSSLLYKSFEEVGILEDGVKQMARMLAEDSHVIFCIGPLTDIAHLLREYPTEAQNIERLYIMGCRLNDDLEHNIRFDAVAAKEVLASNVPMTIIPGDVCGRYKLPKDMIKLGTTPAGVYVLRMLQGFLGAKLATEYIRNSSLSSVISNEAHFWPRGKDDYIGDSISKYQMFLANFDPETACLDPESFWSGFEMIVQKLNENGKESVVEELLALVSTSISVADVFIPYIFLHPDKVTYAQKNLDCDFDGRTFVHSGERHNVVIGFDSKHFKCFLDKYLK
jgi:inosine-uridine nucleoside N-ribohydrolase